MDGVGATLRKARTKREIDLAEVEAATKIRRRFLVAIEGEEWDVLPGDAYARGFIRAYAAHLGLDGPRLAERYPVDPSPSVVGAPARRGSPRLALTLAVCLGVLAVAVAIGIAWGGGGGGAPSAGEIGATAPAKPAPDVAAKQHRKGRAPAPGVVDLELRSTALVWVCVVDGGGRPLVAGREFPAGADIGRFRSGSFTVAFGNGGITMRIDGKRIGGIPDTGSPLGYAIDSSGELTPLPEGRRPTCL